MLSIEKLFIFCLCCNLSNQNYVADVEQDADAGVIVIKNCFVEDLRNIREYIPNPLDVEVNHCYLQELPNALFIRFSDLKSLEICDSRVNNLQDYALNGLKSLEVLNLSKNNLTVIKSWSDHDLVKLTTLDLRRNLIKDINKFSFKRYPNLTKLNLAVNLIESVPENTFKYVPNLKYLNVGKNLLTSIEESMFKGLNKLTHLSVHHNSIKYIDFFSFVGNSHLKSLQLQGNEISVFETDLLSNLPRLTYLNISHNFLEDLSVNTFKKNTDLKILDISYNKFESFHENTFKGLESLEIFNASHNYLESLNKYMFKDFTKVKYFDMSSNNLSLIGNNLFEYTSNIERVNLSKNSIEEIDPNIFAESKKLQKLDLSYNKISNDAFMWSIIGLKYLNLSHNQFKTFNTSLLEDLLEARLYKNPFECKFLVLEMMDFSKNIHFGLDYVVKSHEHILSVPGIDCEDDTGAKRSIVVLEHNLKEDYSSGNSIDPVVENKFFSKIYSVRSLNDTFDSKTILMWMAFGVLIVLVSMKIMQYFLKRSEKQSEQYRISQTVSNFSEENSITTSNNGIDFRSLYNK